MTQSISIEQKFQNIRIIRKIAALVCVICIFSYLCWRLTVFSSDHFLFSLAFYLSESIIYLLTLSHIFSLWKIRVRKQPPPLEGCSVDVFLPVYKEPLEMIRVTLLGTLSIRYPHEIYLLDDGKRDELQQLSKELGVHYIRRPSNEGAKAGNLNYALQQTNAEFFLVFDADHIAQPEVLDLMIGHMKDPKVGLVQIPQEFYNTNSIEHPIATKGHELWHDQSMFYHMHMPGRDRHEATSGIGSGALYRRSHIDEIGGIPTTTVIEDFHTSLLLHQRGYKSVFINEAASYGLAAPDYAEFQRTRHRWAHGNYQAVAEEGYILKSKLTWKQTLCYLCVPISYLDGWAQLAALSIPFICMAQQIAPFELSIFNILLISVFPLALMIYIKCFSAGYTRIFSNEICSLMRFPVVLKATLGLLKFPMKWSATAREITGKFIFKPLWPFIVFGLLNIIALILGFIKMQSAGFVTGPLFKYLITLWTACFSTTPGNSSSQKILLTNLFESASFTFTVDLFILAGTWALYNVFRCIYVIYYVRKKEIDQHQFFRFDLDLPLLTKNSAQYIGYTTKISETHLLSQSSLPKYVQLILPSGPLNLELKRQEDNVYAICWNSQEDRDLLSKNLYSVHWHREQYHPITPKDKTFFNKTYPAFTQCFDVDTHTLVSLNKETREVVLFNTTIGINQSLKVQNGHEQLKIQLIEKLDKKSACTINLDGTSRILYRYAIGSE